MRRIHVSAHRHREVTCIEQDAGQDAIADLRGATVQGLLAGDLILRAVVLVQNTAGQPHVAGKGMGILLVEIGLAGLPAKAPDDGFTLDVIPHQVDLAADAS
ncbi:hypothetical protein D3C85_1576480 [compost metagenome]